MSDWLVLDWEKNRISGLEAEVARGRVRVRRCFEVTLPEEIDPAKDTMAAGEWLKSQLGQRQISAHRALISLPRDEVVVRQLEVPNVPDDDLPGLVRLQAETKTSSLDRMVLDFLPFPQTEPSAQRQVLTVAIRREQIEMLRQITATAGLDLMRVGLSPIGTAEVVSRVEAARNLPPTVGTLVVAQHGPRYEISFLKAGHLLFTHSTQVTSDDLAQSSRMVLAEIRRSQGALGRLDADIGRVWVVGQFEENQQLFDTLQKSLKSDVGLIDPWKDAGVVFDDQVVSSHHALFAGPLGLLLADSNAMVGSIDFLHPRKPVVRPNRRKLWIQAGVVAAGLLLVAGFFGMRSWTKSLEADIADRQERLKRMDETLERGQPTLAALKNLEAWDTQSVSVLNTLDRVTESLPPAERMYLDRLDMASTAGASPARVKALGVARARSDIERLNDRLARDGFAVLPNEIATPTKDSGYPYRAAIELSVPAAESEQGGSR